MIKSIDDSTRSAIRRQSEDLGVTLQKFSVSEQSAMPSCKRHATIPWSQALSRQFSAQHSVLDSRLQSYRQEFEDAIKRNTQNLQVLFCRMHIRFVGVCSDSFSFQVFEKHLERKADVRLVLDKVGTYSVIFSIGTCFLTACRDPAGR
jgi:hypothetical protein